MPYPTFVEARIYKSPFKIFQTRVAVRLDYPIFTSPYHDDFSGSALNTNLWDRQLPSWGFITVSGGVVALGTTIDAISPSYLVSKPNLAFPKNTDTDWTMEARIRFPVITGYGVFFRVASLENAKAVIAVKCNTADGLTVEAPDEITLRWSSGADTSWNRYKLEYDADAQQYTLLIDANDDGVFEIGPFIWSAVDYRADYIVIGNSTARQGTLGTWTEINVDYVDVTGTSEDYDLPSWAGPMYLYDPIGYDQELWAYLPTVLRGRVDFDKDNMADGLQLDLLNFQHGYEPDDPQFQLYTDFSFANRPVRVESRISDGLEWTPWRMIYLGSCDEKQIELRPGGDCVLTVSARDIIRKKLAATHIVRSYAYSVDPMEGIYTNFTVSQTIEDIAQNGVGLPYSAIGIQSTPVNIIQTFNIVGDSAAAAIKRLIDDVVFCWYPRLSDFQIQIEDWFYGTDSPQYELTSRDEIESIQWAENPTDHLAILELGIENTEFMNGGFATNYPHAPVPFFGRSAYESAVVARNAASLTERPIHYLRWKWANRNIGSIEIRMSCQDWVEHNLELDVFDSKYLGIKREHGPWVVDGWSHEWEGTSRFDTILRLVNQHPDRVIRRTLQGQI